MVVWSKSGTRTFYNCTVDLNVDPLKRMLKETFPAEEVHTRLVRQAPPGMQFLSTRQIDFKAGAQVRRAFYRLNVPAPYSDGLAERCAGLLASTELLVERTRPRPRRFNLRPYINKISVECNHRQGASDISPLTTHHSPLTSLEIAVWVTPNGTARPDEIAHLLGLAPLLDETFFERTFLELYDEIAADDVEIIPACILEIPPGSRAPVKNSQAAEVPETSAVLEPQPLSAQDDLFNA